VVKQAWGDYQQPGPIDPPFFSAQPPNKGSFPLTLGSVVVAAVKPPISVAEHTLGCLGEQFLKPSVANAEWTVIIRVAANIAVTKTPIDATAANNQFHRRKVGRRIYV
jgi:hypothetical protein